MAGLYDGVEEIPFKKVDSGYLFKSNPAWFVGPKDYYLVTEAQKAEIAACLKETLKRLIPLIIVTAILLPLAVIGGVFWLAMISTSPSKIMLFAMLLTLALFVPYIGFMHVYSMRRLRPLIANLPKSDERFTMRETNAGFATKISPKLLVMSAVCCSLGLAINLMNFGISFLHNRPLNSWTIAIPITISALTTLYFIYIALIRMKLQKGAVQTTN